MADVKDGGSAFPFQLTVVDRNNPENIQKARAQGMTLRDWFAGQALAGLLAHSSGEDPHKSPGMAWHLADAMLKARETGE